MKHPVYEPDRFKAVLIKEKEILIGTFAERHLDGLPRVEIKNFPLSAAAEVSLNRADICLSAPTGFDFHTRTLDLGKDTLAEPDVDVASFIINAVKSQAVLADGKPVLDTPLEETVAGLTRLPNEEVSLTEMPRSEINRLRGSLENLFGGNDGGGGTAAESSRNSFGEHHKLIAAETPLRAVARAFLTEFFAGANNSVVAFVLIDDRGFGIGLWNAAWGLFYERAEPLPEEYKFEESLYGADSGDGSAKSAEEALKLSFIRNFVDFVLQTAAETAREKCDEMALGGVEQIILATGGAVKKVAENSLHEFSLTDSIHAEILGESLDEKIIRGLLYAEKPNTPLPRTDLLRDLYVRDLDNSLEIERRRLAAQKRARTHAAYALLVPFVLFIGFIIGTLSHYARSSAMLAVRNTRADQETRRLKPILDARASYVENFNWREAYLRQILNLRDRQTVAISFLPEIDRRYLVTNDPRFAFTMLKLNPNGEWEMRGVAQSEDAVGNFVRGLEFAETAAAGGTGGYRIFTNLSPEFGKGLSEKLPGEVGSPFKGTAATPAGWFGWEIKGSYVPLVRLAPRPVPVNSPLNQPAQSTQTQPTSAITPAAQK